MSQWTVRGGLVLVLSVGLAGCAPGIDARKRASLPQRETQRVGGAPVDHFARTHATALLTGADEVDHLHLARPGVQGVFRLEGRVCRTVGGCAAVPIDARGYWLTAGHCVDSGAALIYDPAADGVERGVPTRIVWQGATPGLDLALLYAPLPEGFIPVEVAPSVRAGAEVICVGSGIRTHQLSAGHVVGIGGSTDGAVTWIEHDAPLAAGDSGGPAFYRDGLLAGINFEAGRSRSGATSRATAIQPDMRQVMARIEADWGAQPASR